MAYRDGFQQWLVAGVDVLHVGIYGQLVIANSKFLEQHLILS